MSEGNFTRSFEHVDDNTESEIDDAITTAFDHVVQWLEEEEGKEVKAALERREVDIEQFYSLKLLLLLLVLYQHIVNVGLFGS